MQNRSPVHPKSKQFCLSQRLRSGATGESLVSRIVGLIGNLNGTILLTLEWRRTNSALIDPPMNIANELKRALIGQHKLTCISRPSQEGGRQRTCSRATRRSASPPTSPSCRSCWGAKNATSRDDDHHHANVQRIAEHRVRDLDRR
jgi:hypothetical protein